MWNVQSGNTRWEASRQKYNDAENLLNNKTTETVFLPKLWLLQSGTWSTLPAPQWPVWFFYIYFYPFLVYLQMNHHQFCEITFKSSSTLPPKSPISFLSLPKAWVYLTTGVKGQHWLKWRWVQSVWKINKQKERGENKHLRCVSLTLYLLVLPLTL